MRDYFFAALVILAIAVGYVLLLQPLNDRIEAECAASGGQMLTQPGEVSRCLRPAH